MYKILLCVLLAPCTGISAAEDYVYGLHVTLPPALGQDQTKELKTIQKIITDNVKRNDSYVFKHVAKPEVYAFLVVENVCVWEDISDAFTARGYIYDVIPLRKGEDFIEEIGIPKVPKQLQAGELDKTNQYSLWSITFTQKDRTNAEYKALIKRHFMKYKQIEKKAQEIVWIVMAKEPVSVLAITPYLPRRNDKLEHVYEVDTEVEEQQVEMIPVVLFDIFKSCNC